MPKRDIKITSTLSQKTRKDSQMQRKERISLPRIMPERFYLYLSIFLFLILGCSSSGSNKTPLGKNTVEIVALQKTLAQQEELLGRLQALTADQLLRNNELEQALPPRDLLESLQNGLVELQKKTRRLEKQVSELKKVLEKYKAKKKSSKSSADNYSSNQEQIIRGLVSLQSGNPDQAVEHLQDILKSKKATKLKGEILMAIGNGFLTQGHAKQAASHYGIFLHEYPKSRHVPQAMYFLGEAMEELGEEEKQKILWKELIQNYPESSLAKRTKKRLRSSSASSN